MQRNGAPFQSWWRQERSLPFSLSSPPFYSRHRERKRRRVCFWTSMHAPISNFDLSILLKSRTSTTAAAVAASAFNCAAPLHHGGFRRGRRAGVSEEVRSVWVRVRSPTRCLRERRGGVFWFREFRFPDGAASAAGQNSGQLSEDGGGRGRYGLEFGLFGWFRELGVFCDWRVFLRCVIVNSFDRVF